MGHRRDLVIEAIFDFVGTVLRAVLDLILGILRAIF
jgi:hypothetical protein